MIVNRSNPLNLFEMLSELGSKIDSDLVELDGFLNNDGPFGLDKADLSRRCITAFSSPRSRTRRGGFLPEARRGPVPARRLLTPSRRWRLGTGACGGRAS